MKYLISLLVSVLLLLPTWSSLSIEGQYSQIAFVGQVSDNDDIILMNSDGSNQIQLTTDPSNEGHPAWSPDGTRIAFSTDRDGNSEIYVMNADGTNPVNLTNDEGADDWRPMWSPDGRQIAFVTNRDGNAEIYVMNANGTNPINLTNEEKSDIAPNWSPDGTQIAFATNRDGNFEIYMMNADGTNPVNLTISPENLDYLVSWSPTGEWIAFAVDDQKEATDGVAEAYQRDPQIFLMQPDGTDVTLVNTQKNTSYQGLTWSPDGKKLAILSGESPQKLIILDIETRRTDFLYNAIEGNAFFSPSWSPWLDTTRYLPSPTPTMARPDYRYGVPPECPNSPPSRLGMEMIAAVVLPKEGEVRRNLRVRDTPGGEQIGSLEPGTQFRLTEIGVCGEDGLLWWPLETLDGSLEGWSVEGFAPDDYLMVPISSP